MLMVLVLVALILGACRPIQAPPPGAAVEQEPAAETPKLDDATAAEIETLVTEMMARTGLPGFALGVVKDGELVYAKGFGTTSLDGGAPVTPQTVFQWAETSMALTAMAALQLAEQGKLDLDAPVTDYIPYFQMKDEGYKDITVRQLLTHSSGIPDSGDAMADWENFMPQYDAGATERWIRKDLAEKGLLFAPGTGFEYSDIAYALLGAVVGAASGQTYEEYMSENIFAPLGMDKSTFLLEDVDKTLLASPHVPDAAGELAVSKVQPYHRPFAGTNNLFSSIEDMAKLAQANLNRGELDGQRILPESAYEQMWEPYSPTPYADFPFGRVHPASMMIDWGYGWFLGEAAGQRVPNTFGGEHGYSAQMVLAPDANLGVIAIGNAQAMDEFYSSDMATDVLGMLLEGQESTLGTQEYAHPEALASTAWLAEHLSDPAVRIVDGREPPDEGEPASQAVYESGHIPGAVYVDVWDDLSDPNGAVPGLILPKAEFEALMGRLGIGDDTTVVVYDDVGAAWMARLWWALRYYGHDDVMVLDGGLKKWMEEGRPLEEGAVVPEPATFTAEVRPELLADVEEVKQAIEEPNVVLIDALSAEFYSGEYSIPGLRAGHIPTAFNLPAPDNLNPNDYTLLSAGELAQLWQKIDLKPTQRAITYCGAGYFGALDLFALYQLGHDGFRPLRRVLDGMGCEPRSTCGELTLLRRLKGESTMSRLNRMVIVLVLAALISVRASQLLRSLRHSRRMQRRWKSWNSSSKPGIPSTRTR